MIGPTIQAIQGTKQFADFRAEAVFRLIFAERQYSISLLKLASSIDGNISFSLLCSFWENLEYFLPQSFHQ